LGSGPPAQKVHLSILPREPKFEAWEPAGLCTQIIAPGPDARGGSVLGVHLGGS
jgi:hypothetical protein